MLIASIILFLLALYVSLVFLLAVARIFIGAIVHGKDLATAGAKMPISTMELFVVSILWTAFYAVRVYA